MHALLFKIRKFLELHIAGKDIDIHFYLQVFIFRGLL